MTADICVIVPTIRNPECIRSYVRNARDHDFDTDRLEFVLVTEDFCDTDAMESLFTELDITGHVFDGTAREAWFEEHDVSAFSHLVPEASHAQTSFGLLYMWSKEFPYGVFIDDDTLPHDEVDFFGTHMENLAHEGIVEHVSSDEQWVNVLYQAADEHGLYPRGYPYAAMDESVETTAEQSDHVVASQGLWTDVPDLDAVRILMDGDLQGQAQTRTERSHFGEDFVAAPGNYLTVCSMNLAFRREVIPAFYQLPMDDNPWDVGRFDDIWSGVFLKRACDLLGTTIYNGDPLCVHEKAPRSTFSDLTNEVHGLELNEHVWELVDDARPTHLPERDAEQPGPTGYAAAFEAMGESLASGDFEDWENGAFLNHCGEYMLDWLDCLDELRPNTITATDRSPAAADD